MDEDVFGALFIREELQAMPLIQMATLAVANGYPVNGRRDAVACINWMIENGARQIEYEDALERNRAAARERIRGQLRPAVRNYPARQYAADFVNSDMRSQQRETAAVKHRKWSQQFERAIINSTATLTVDGITIDAWFLDQGFRAKFNALPFNRKQFFMIMCDEIYDYLTDTMELQHEEVVGAEREIWNMKYWMTITLETAQSDLGEGENDCWLWTGPMSDYGRPRIATNNVNLAKVNVLVSHMMICLNPDAGISRNENGQYFEVSHACPDPRCVRPRHLNYEDHDTNLSRINCIAHCILNCQHNPTCIPTVDGREVTCLVHLDGPCPNPGDAQPELIAQHEGNLNEAPVNWNMLELSISSEFNDDRKWKHSSCKIQAQQAGAMEFGSIINVYSLAEFT